MKRCFELLLLLCSSVIAIAQNNLPPVYEIKTDTAVYTALPNSYWQILEDKDGKYSFDDVRKQPVANRFHYYTSKSDQQDYSIHSYWFRYALKNTTDHDAKICLFNSIVNWNEQSDFYFINSEGKTTHQVNGFLTPWSKLNGIKEYRIIPLELKPNEEIIIYRRTYNSYHFGLSPLENLQLEPGFGSTEKANQLAFSYSQDTYFNAIHDIFIFGVLLFAAFFIFMFFVITWEKVYLYFSLYVFVLSVGRFNIHSEMYDVFFREHPLAFAYIFDVIWFFSAFFLAHFIRHLLNTKFYLPKWDKFLVFFSLLYALTYLVKTIIDVTATFSNLLHKIAVLEMIVIALSIPVTFFVSVKWFKQNKVLIYIVLPLQSIWSVCWSMATLHQHFDINTIRWLQDNWYGFETVLLCCLVVSFSWVLLQRFGDLKKQIVQKELEKEIERSQIIEQQKTVLEEQVTERTADLNKSLKELKDTQAQLIQSEKMASLGELTAGIAHEIQNPLNFVNNFSDVNAELVDELQTELKSGNTEEAISIAQDIKDNEQKINLHGKRADSIVKGMLQHSRASSGQRELTDINKLADEYLRLSYHGMRAKDKSFNAEYKTDFDETIGKINVVPQDIGMVLLNLFNNAFYAVNEKNKTGPLTLPINRDRLEGGIGKLPNEYMPLITVRTKLIPPLEGKREAVEIRVSDNGNGIPQSIVDKIFQPFFTTKPTGQGTGLGLSLAYDIIKAHGGEIKVETKEGVGSEFIIQL
jgi:signal transduction histidine kinase